MWVRLWVIVDELGVGSVLDVGCGTGTFVCLLAERGIDVVGGRPGRCVARRRPSEAPCRSRALVARRGGHAPTSACGPGHDDGQRGAGLLTDEDWAWARVICGASPSQTPSLALSEQHDQDLRWCSLASDSVELNWGAGMVPIIVGLSILALTSSGPSWSFGVGVRRHNRTGMRPRTVTSTTRTRTGSQVTAAAAVAPVAASEVPDDRTLS